MDRKGGGEVDRELEGRGESGGREAEGRRERRGGC